MAEEIYLNQKEWLQDRGQEINTSTLYAKLDEPDSDGTWGLLSPIGQAIPLKARVQDDITEIDIQQPRPGIYFAQYLRHGHIIYSKRVLIFTLDR